MLFSWASRGTTTGKLLDRTPMELQSCPSNVRVALQPAEKHRQRTDALPRQCCGTTTRFFSSEHSLEDGPRRIFCQLSWKPHRILYLQTYHVTTIQVLMIPTIIITVLLDDFAASMEVCLPQPLLTLMAYFSKSFQLWDR